MKLIELLKRNEGKTLEYKRDLSSPDGILRTLIAFANTAGGTVVIGVDDGSKNVRGVPDSLEAEEKLANFVSDSIRPPLIPEIEVVPWKLADLHELMLRDDCSEGRSLAAVFIVRELLARRAAAQCAGNAFGALA